MCEPYLENWTTGERRPVPPDLIEIPQGWRLFLPPGYKAVQLPGDTADA